MKTRIALTFILVTAGVSIYEVGRHIEACTTRHSLRAHDSHLDFLVMQQQIDDGLLAAEARKRNIPISDEELNCAIKETQARFSSRTEYEKELRKEGLSQETLRTKLRVSLMVSKMIKQELRKPNPHRLDSNQRLAALLETLRQGERH